MKKLINDPADVVGEMLAGLALLNPAVRLHRESLVLYQADARDPTVLDQVALVSGGGAGHEPAHAGYVGPGMLSAAVAGEVFTSPSTDAVLDAIRLVAGPMGVLLIVKNYTGDRLNFGLAAEIARNEGVDVELVVVADDVALSADGPHAGRRGLAGTILVHKIAGAAAAEGRPLADVAEAARSAAAALGTMGVALTPCTVPAAGRAGFELGDDEIEWGLGIHGESGVRRTTLEPATDIVAGLLTPVLSDLGMGAGSRVALLVNNLGGSATGELNLVAGVAVEFLRSREIVVERAWSGTFLTALEMAGCSISVLEVDDERLARLDAPSAAPAWPSHLGRVAEAVVEVDVPQPAEQPDGPLLSGESTLRRALEAVCATLLEAEPMLTEMDSRVGDGDLGDSMARAARSILAEIDSYPAETAPAAVLRRMSATVRRVVGGTSGPLYAVMLLRAAATLDVDGPGAANWADAFTAGVSGVQELGGASPGDRTMVDALAPAAAAFADQLQQSDDAAAALSVAVEEARAGAAGTADLTARLGRSSYVGDRARGFPDPGAHAVALWLAAVRDAVTGSAARR